MADSPGRSVAPSTRPVSTWRMLATLYGSRIRSQASYRASLAADIGAQVLMIGAEIVELWAILWRAGSLGGMTFAQVLLVYGLAALAFGIADLLLGEIDAVAQYVRSGRIETLLIRPVPLLVQVSSLDLSLKRLGRVGTGLVLYVAGLAVNGVALTPAHALLAVVAPLAGAAIMSAVLVMAGALQFWLVDGREFTNAFVYGGNYVASNPGSVLMLPLRAFFTFVVPATLIAYAPALVLLDLPGPALIPQWAGWLGAPMALVAWALALILWRAGVRRYTGAGG